jgi:hypothetical protein
MIRTRILQVIILLLPVLVFGWLLWQELVPSGVFVVSHQVGERSPFIDGLLPDGRVEEPMQDFDGDLVQAIIDDPVFFFVHPHRGFDSVEMEVWFKNDAVPIVEMGGLAQEAGQVYDLQPLQNLLIDQSTWSRLEQNGVTLLQRERTFERIADFLVNPPPRYEIATYHYQLTRPYVIEGYIPSSEERVIDVSLRGFHEFKTYVKDETLRYEIAYMDMNRAEGPDPVSVVVVNEFGEPVGSAYASDDGDTSGEGRPSSLKTLSVSIPNLSEGVYKVELRAERDVFFRRLTTSQQKIVFMNNLYLGDEVAWKESARAVSFWTEAKNLAFQTQHAEGVQDVQVGEEKVNIVEPYARYPFTVLEDGVVRTTLPKADALVHTDGHIAFSPDQFFNPDPVRLRETTDLDGLGVNYVIADYTSPERVGNWLVSKAVFDTRVLFQDEGAWKFTFSTPGIRDLGAQLDVGRINMTWTRAPLRFSDLLDALTRFL